MDQGERFFFDLEDENDLKRFQEMFAITDEMAEDSEIEPDSDADDNMPDNSSSGQSTPSTRLSIEPTPSASSSSSERSSTRQIVDPEPSTRLYLPLCLGPSL